MSEDQASTRPSERPSDRAIGLPKTPCETTKTSKSRERNLTTTGSVCCLETQRASAECADSDLNPSGNRRGRGWRDCMVVCCVDLACAALASSAERVLGVPSQPATLEPSA